MIQDTFEDDFEYRVDCDGCNKQLKNPNDEKGTFIADFDDVANIVKSKGWTVNGNYCYCPKCAKAMYKYGYEGCSPLIFAINNYTFDDDDKKAAKGMKLLQDGLKYVKSLGYIAGFDDDCIKVSVFAVPDLIKFYADKGVSVKRESDSFFELVDTKK